MKYLILWRKDEDYSPVQVDTVDTYGLTPHTCTTLTEAILRLEELASDSPGMRAEIYEVSDEPLEVQITYTKPKVVIRRESSRL